MLKRLVVSRDVFHFALHKELNVFTSLFGVLLSCQLFFLFLSLTSFHCLWCTVPVSSFLYSNSLCRIFIPIMFFYRSVFYVIPSPLPYCVSTFPPFPRSYPSCLSSPILPFFLSHSLPCFQITAWNMNRETVIMNNQSTRKMIKTPDKRTTYPQGWLDRTPGEQKTEQGSVMKED